MQVKSCLSRLGVVLMLASNRMTFASPLPGYDFAYRAGGNPEIQPVQVFNDGHDTYFQFLSPEHLPAIFARVQGHEGLATEKIQPPYVIVNGMAKHYTLKLEGMQTAYVDYDGPKNVGFFQAFKTPPIVRTGSGTPALISEENPVVQPRTKTSYPRARIATEPLASSSYPKDHRIPVISGRARGNRPQISRVNRAAWERTRGSQKIQAPFYPHQEVLDSQPQHYLAQSVRNQKAFSLDVPLRKVQTPSAAKGYLAPAGMRLSIALGQYLHAWGIALKWDYPGDFQLLEPLIFPGRNHEAVISRTLGQFNLEGTLYSRSRILVVKVLPDSSIQERK